jgi:hypothetical protein
VLLLYFTAIFPSVRVGDTIELIISIELTQLAPWWQYPILRLMPPRVVFAHRHAYRVRQD